MSDLKFYSSVLDKMPVGTSFRDSDHVVTKKIAGWECEDCSSPTIKASSSSCMSDPSEAYALERFAGAEIELDDLDPRLIAFLPVGTRVADRDTGSDNRCHWYKTKTGRWLWAESREEAEASASDGIGHEDLSDFACVGPFRLFSLGTDEVPESVAVGEEFKAAVATKLTDYALKDVDGDIWRFDKTHGCWRMSWANGSPSGILNGTLSGGHDPYTVYEKADSEPEKIPEGKTIFSAAEATNFKDCRFLDSGRDVWVFDEETQRWRFILPNGELSYLCQDEKLSHALEPFTLVEDEPETEAETETKPAEGTKLSAAEASEHKDAVFEDNDGDTWFYDYGLQRWRAIGPDWAYADEKLNSLYSPFTKIGPYYKFERGWTAGEADAFKDEALEDKDGDIWIYDVPSEKWRCNNPDGFVISELNESFQPYRIKKAATGTATPIGTEDPSPEAGGTEEVTFEGSAKEAVELLDRIARSLESIDRKLGDK